MCVSRSGRVNERETEGDSCRRTLTKTRGTRLIRQGAYRMRLVLPLPTLRQGSESFEHRANGLGGVRHGLQMRDDPLCLVLVVNTVSGHVEEQAEEQVPEQNRSRTHTHNTHTENTHTDSSTHTYRHTQAHAHIHGDGRTHFCQVHTHTHIYIRMCVVC